MLTDLNVISGSCISKLTGPTIHFFSMLSFPFYAFVFTSAENMLLLPGLYVQRSARQQSLMKVLSLKKREVIKAAEKDPSATIVASICLTGATCW